MSVKSRGGARTLGSSWVANHLPMLGSLEFQIGKEFMTSSSTIINALIDSGLERLKQCGHLGANRSNIMTEKKFSKPFKSMIEATLVSSTDHLIIFACRDILEKLGNPYVGNN